MKIDQNDKEPPSIRIALYSDWHIQEVGTWSDVNKKFPVDTSTLGEPYEPLRAFYLHLISQNTSITDVYIRDDHALIIKLNDYTIEVPSMTDFTELSWTIDADDDPELLDFNVSFNNEENKVLVSIPDNLN